MNCLLLQKTVREHNEISATIEVETITVNREFFNI